MGILQRKSILFCILYFGFGFGKINGFPEDDTPFSAHSYDFIIVGGGTAGCAVASRLSENGKYSVLVLESGDYPEDFMEVPALGIRSPENPAITFQYFSVPQRAGLSTYRNGVIPSPVARVLGGTSQINHNVINRGNPKDYDNWANLTGDPTWKYSNMLRYFKRSETYLGQFPDPEQHGFQGPVPVSYQHYAPGREVFEEAVNELGHQLEDPNGPQRISFTPVEFSRKFGRRHSSYRAYIESIVKPRKNLKIIVKAHATEIIFDEGGHRAIGVKYILNRTADHFQKETVAWANREIILSSGTFGSSLLLMKSGIGPRKVLEDAGIPQRMELPVGENFQDHPTVVLYIVLNNKSLSFDMERDLTQENFEIWRKYGIGPYSTALGYSGQTFQASKVAQREGNGDWPDHHIALGANTMLLEPFRGNYLEPWETFVRIHIYLGRQKSRGTVEIDRDGEPIIDYKYMEDKRDEDVFFDGVKNTLKVFLGTKAYQKRGARLFKEPLPACAGFKFRTEKYWRCYIRHVIIPGYHPVGTCAMGSVVDSKLRVYGFKGLRVVDGSIQPFIVNSNLHAGIYAIAEKASEDILKDNEEVEGDNSHFWREHRDLRNELPNKNKDYSYGWRN